MDGLKLRGRRCIWKFKACPFPCQQAISRVVTLRQWLAESNLLSLASETLKACLKFTETWRKCWRGKSWKQWKCSPHNQGPWTIKQVGRAETWKGSWRPLRASEECIGRAERGPELVIKEKCRWLSGVCGYGGEQGDQWFYIFLFLQHGEEGCVNPQCHSPQGCCFDMHLALGHGWIEPWNKHLWSVIVVF